MAKKLLIFVVALCTLMAIASTAGIVLFASLFMQPDCGTTSDSTVSSAQVVIDGDSIIVGDKPLDSDQIRIAEEIIGQGRARNLSEKDIITAVAVGYQESGLRNLDHGDEDSLGVFQQRPSQGWGTPEQILTVSYAVGKFYDELETLRNRHAMTELEIALAVQRPDRRAYLGQFPYSANHRFTNWLPLARALVAAGADSPVTEMTTQTSAQCTVEQTASGVPRLTKSLGKVGTCPGGTPTRIGEAPGGGQVQLCDVFGVEIEAGISANLEALFIAARQDGIVFGGWGYRSHSTQIDLREEHCGTSYYAIWQMPSDHCNPPTAIPGKSDHEWGRAWDGTVNGFTVAHDDPGHRWLRKNAQRWNFVEHHIESWHWYIPRS